MTYRVTQYTHGLYCQINPSITQCCSTALIHLNNSIFTFIPGISIEHGIVVFLQPPSAAQWVIPPPLLPPLENPPQISPVHLKNFPPAAGYKHSFLEYNYYKVPY